MGEDPLPLIGSCLKRIFRWRVPPNWSISDWRMLRLASDGNNNNNNNTGGGGSITATRAGLSREELLQKLSSSMSDDQLQDILKQQGII
jgi:hypothetical protein